MPPGFEGTGESISNSVDRANGYYIVTRSNVPGYSTRDFRIYRGRSR